MCEYLIVLFCVLVFFYTIYTTVQKFEVSHFFFFFLVMLNF